MGGISGQALSSGLFVKNSVVPSELCQTCTSSGLNLIQLSFYFVQAKKWRRIGRGREEGIEKEREGGTHE